jgi:predicted ATPase/class 3 adenylate cyclase
LSTDIDGAMALLGLGDDAYVKAITEHRGQLWSGRASDDGVGLDTRSDTLLATFTSPRDCVAAAMQIQRGLADLDGSNGARGPVGMGIHTADVSDLSSHATGHEVRQAAHVAAVAHGGQVLLSAATADLLVGALPANTALQALGSHRLRDLGCPEPLFQLLAPGLAERFPPLRSLDNSELPNNLPDSLSPFVGRVKELGEVVELIGTPRVVTLTGAGGSGKTRLALQAAAEVLDGSGEGVWLVELAPVRDPADVPMAVAGALNLRVEADRSPTDTLIATLCNQSLLLVLDNCEHVIESVAELVGRIAEGCPRVSLLATSREPLGVDGERVYRVRSLSLPPEDTQDAAELAGSDAVQLFVTRAARDDPGFSLDDGSAFLAGSVCRRLDGIPLAIELAAARQSSMSLEDLSRRLDERFHLLTGGSRNTLPRQQTLDAMVGWSYDMLTEAERVVLRRLSVFIDGFDLGGAQVVCATEGVESSEITQIVGSLVDKSLVGAERVSGTMWYSLLEVIRHFAAERLLQEDGEANVTEVRRRHAQYHLELCERAGPVLQFGGENQVDWVHLFDRQWGNLQRALAFFEWEPDGVGEIVRFVWSLGSYDLTRGHRQPCAALQAVLDRTREESPDLRCRALIAWAYRGTHLDNDLAAVQEAVLAAAEEAVGLARQLGDRQLEVMAMVEQARALQLLERHAPALSLADECLAAARALANPSLLGRAHDQLAAVLTDAAAAQSHRLEALACFREAGDLVLECTELMLVAISGWENMKDVWAGRGTLEDALVLAEQLGSGGHLAYLSANLAITCAILDDLEAAEEYCRRNLRLMRRLGMTQGFIPFDIQVMSRCVANRGDAVVGAQLAGASDAFWDSVARPTEFTLTPLELDLIARNRVELTEVLGEVEFDRLFEAGQRLSVDKAVDLALGRILSPV